MESHVVDDQVGMDGNMVTNTERGSRSGGQIRSSVRRVHGSSMGGRVRGGPYACEATLPVPQRQLAATTTCTKVHR